MDFGGRDRFTTTTTMTTTITTIMTIIITMNTIYIRTENYSHIYNIFQWRMLILMMVNEMLMVFFYWCFFFLDKMQFVWTISHTNNQVSTINIHSSLSTQIAHTPIDIHINIHTQTQIIYNIITFSNLYVVWNSTAAIFFSFCLSH